MKIKLIATASAAKKVVLRMVRHTDHINWPELETADGKSANTYALSQRYWYRREEYRKVLKEGFADLKDAGVITSALWTTRSGATLSVQADGLIVINGSRRAIRDGLSKFVANNHELIEGIKVVEVQTSQPDWLLFDSYESRLEQKVAALTGRRSWEIARMALRNPRAWLRAHGLTSKEVNYMAREYGF